MSKSGVTPPPDPSAAPPSVAFAVSRLGFAVGSRLASDLRPLGVEPRDFGLLRAVAATQGQTQRALSKTLELSPNRMVALVDQLERKRLLRRRPHPTDRRAHALLLTPRGEQVLAKAFQIALTIESELCADLQPAERDQLLKLLFRLHPLHAGPPGVHPGLASATGENPVQAPESTS
jgi:DNA-binding MarR family transcriptional regulator